MAAPTRQRTMVALASTVRSRLDIGLGLGSGSEVLDKEISSVPSALALALSLTAAVSLVSPDRRVKALSNSSDSSSASKQDTRDEHSLSSMRCRRLEKGFGDCHLRGIVLGQY